MKDSKTISTRISRGLYNDLEKHSDKISKNMASIFRESVYMYLERKDDIELMELNQKIIDNNSKYIKAFNEQRYRELENTNITETLNRNTFIEFMDNYLAQVYITNKPYKSTEELKKIMRNSLEALKDRAEHSDELEQYKERMETPIAYTEEFLDRKATEEEAFKDSGFSPRVGF